MRTVKRPVIPGYHIVRRLGGGTFGDVYQAYSDVNAGAVAIKVLKPATSDAAKRFFREARQLAHQIRNPYIVDYISADLSAKPPYIIMEYCEGGSLRGWVEEPRPWQDVAAGLLHASLGLAALHQAGGFHRDVKPDNLLLAKRGQGELIIKLGDFGLARLPPVDKSTLTKGARGTEAYLPPDVLGGGNYTASADIYSLGITGIELLMCSRDPALLDQCTAPRELSELLESMVNTNGNRRPTINDVSTALRLVLQEPPPTKKPVSKSSKAGDLLAPLLVGGLIIGGVALLASIASGDDEE